MVNEELQALPIVDKIIKDYRGRIANVVEFPTYSVGKELQAHVLELKSKKPFRTPKQFEDTIYQAIIRVSEFLKQKYGASLLGLGMHPFIKLEEAKIWWHRHRTIYKAYQTIFNMRQHGWLNIQAFQLNLPYGGRRNVARVHNAVANLIPYLPALAASSPVFEGKIGGYVDNRLHFYMLNQKEVPSLVGDVVPEYIDSLEDYQKKIIERYSRDLEQLGADRCILYKDWMNSRGATLRLDRRAIEIRVLDEQECVKSDVAISCFIRSTLRGMLNDTERTPLQPHEVLVNDFNSTMRRGLDARVLHPKGPTAKAVCEYLYDLGFEHADDEEKRYLPIVRRRIEEGNLSELIVSRVKERARKTDNHDAIMATYGELIKSLMSNTPYF